MAPLLAPIRIRSNYLTYVGPLSRHGPAGKRVALLKVAAGNAAAEPLHPLLGAAVGKAFRNHVSLSALLHPVVADLGSGVESFFDVTVFQNATLAICMVRPDACQTIRLQFKPDRQSIGFPLAGTALQRLNFPHDAEKILHVMADFVGDHVGLGEVARRSEALAQFTVEGKVDVKLLIGAAVERTCRRLAITAGRLDGVREKYQSWFLIGLPAGLEDFIPGALRASEHARDELPHLVICAGLLRLWRRTLRVVAFLHVALQQHSRIEAKKERQQDDYEGTDSASCDPARDATTTTIFDVLTFLFSIEIHRSSPFTQRLYGRPVILLVG